MSRLRDIADALKDAAVQAFADSADPPEVAYVADGQITNEIGPERETGPYSAIVVTWDRVSPGPAAGGADQLVIYDGYMMTATFSVFVLRLQPQPASGYDVVPFDVLEEAAAVLLDDAWRILSGVVSGYASSMIGGICGAAAIVAQTPVGPEGGVEGSRLQVAVQLL